MLDVNSARGETLMLLVRSLLIFILATLCNVSYADIDGRLLKNIGDVSLLSNVDRYGQIAFDELYGKISFDKSAENKIYVFVNTARGASVNGVQIKFGVVEMIVQRRVEVDLEFNKTKTAKKKNKIVADITVWQDSKIFYDDTGFRLDEQIVHVIKDLSSRLINGIEH